MHMALSDINDAGDSPSLPPGKVKSAPEMKLIYNPRQYKSKCNFFRAYSSFDTVECETKGITSHSCTSADHASSPNTPKLGPWT